MDNALLARSFEHTTRYLTKLIRRTPMSFDPDRPYDDLSLVPPKAEIESKLVLKKTTAANKALAELKGAGDLNPKLLDLLQGRGK